MEDTHYSFVEYGGNNITHWSFLDSIDLNHPNILVDRLCGRLFLIVDKDSINTTGQNNNKSKKEKRYTELKKKLKSRFYALKCQEIENLLLPNIIMEIINSFKNQNVIEKDSFVHEDYKLKYLGEFIDKKFGYRLKKKYAAKSGTILNKVEFAKRAVTFINDKKDMSKEAFQLGEKIYSFINENNFNIY